MLMFSDSLAADQLSAGAGQKSAAFSNNNHSAKLLPFFGKQLAPQTDTTELCRTKTADCKIFAILGDIVLNFVVDVIMSIVLSAAEEMWQLRFYLK